MVFGWNSSKMRPLRGLGCEASASKPLTLVQAYPLYSSLRKSSSGEVVCVNSSLLDYVIETATFATPRRLDIAEVWRDMETMSHVDECGPEVKAGIGALVLATPNPAPSPPNLAHPEKVRVVDLSCPVEHVFQCLLGSLAELNLRHTAAVHDAVHSEWRRRFGAHVACIGDDTLLIDVLQPAKTHAEIRQLLWEHYVYCDGEQGVDLEAAGQSFCEMHPHWGFWWD